MRNERCRMSAALGLGLGFVVAWAITLVPARADDKATALFNGKDLAGWTIFIRHADKSDPRADPKGVFKDEDGVIHISGQEFGCLDHREGRSSRTTA